ncbi:OsmC family protein [Ectothiorhodospiraceae bacterium WFHF3C12]|nr:OsmC family protein [Ectothiorhodospiraceae bacterium WFHF3C12]
MDTEALRAKQAPLKSRYRTEPEAAMITLRAEGRVGEDVTCSVDTGRALVEAGLHPSGGGTGLHACSGDMLLQALAACAGVTFGAVATSMGVVVDDARVTAEGELDARGTLGVAKDVPVGFKAVRLRWAIDSPEPPETLDTLLQLTERYCVVLQTLTKGVPVTLVRD